MHTCKTLVLGNLDKSLVKVGNLKGLNWMNLNSKEMKNRENIETPHHLVVPETKH